MQSFCSSPAARLLSWGRGAEASAPPVKDAFQEVFQTRLLARLTANENPKQESGRASTRLSNADTREVNSRRQPGCSRTAVRYQQKASASPSPRTAALRLASAVRDTNPRQGLPHTPKKPESQTPVLGLATGQSQALAPPWQNQTGSAGADPPPALREIIALLQTLPGGTLNIPAEQAPAVASALLSAGLPPEEVNRLLFSSDSSKCQARTLSAAELQAAWQRSARALSPRSGGETAPGSGPAPAGAGPSQEAPEIQQTQGHRALWERLTIPESLLPTLRLALARLGASPEVMTRLEEEAQGQGIPLTKVWDILHNLKAGPALGAPGETTPAASAGTLFQSAQLGERPVTGGEMEEWRHLLLKAGLKPEVVENLLGRASPSTQEELKTTLLAVAPAADPIPDLDPQPLFLPPHLRLRAFFWQNQTGGEQPPLTGNGAEENGRNLAKPFTVPSAAVSPAETLALPSFPAELQGFNQGLAGPGAAPLSSPGPAWRLLSPEIRESLWSQLQSGVIANLGQGENRVTLSLNPPELGQIQLTLRLSGQELAVTAVATRPEVAEMATLGVPQLLQALTQQDLVLTQFQVRLQDQPQTQAAPVFTAARERGSAPSGNSSTSARRRSGEVDRFV